MKYYLLDVTFIVICRHICSQCKSYIQTNSKKYYLLNISNFLCLYSCIYSGARDERRANSSEISTVDMGHEQKAINL